jgi:hypothetical protein
LLNVDGMVLRSAACLLRSIEMLAQVTKGYRTNGRLHLRRKQRAVMSVYKCQFYQ